MLQPAQFRIKAFRVRPQPQSEGATFESLVQKLASRLSFSPVDKASVPLESKHAMPPTPKQRWGRLSHTVLALFVVLLAWQGITLIASFSRLLAGSWSRSSGGTAAAGGEELELTQGLYWGLHNGSVALNSSVRAAFAAAPWLLPRGSQLPYYGLHTDLDRLLQAQAVTVGEHPAVSLIFFNYHQTWLLMNCLYSMAKFAGVRNYIIVVWEEASLGVCLDMNLPCFNAAPWLPGSIDSSHEALFMSADYLKIMWMRPLLIADIVNKGYAVHQSDVDIAYSPFDLMQSYTAYLTEAGATAAFQIEHPINGGNYFVLPTAAGKAWVNDWVARMDFSFAHGLNEQQALNSLEGRTYEMCEFPWACRKKLANLSAATAAAVAAGGRRRNKILMRRTLSAYRATFQDDMCAAKHPAKLYAVDPCAAGFPHLYFHAVCLTGMANKVRALNYTGYWFIDIEQAGCAGNGTGAGACTPLAWRRPQVEEAFMRCDRRRLAFRYYDELF